MFQPYLAFRILFSKYFSLHFLLLLFFLLQLFFCRHEFTNFNVYFQSISVSPLNITLVSKNLMFYLLLALAWLFVLHPSLLWSSWPLLSIYNPRQNIWHKLKKCNKIGQDFKNVISSFACFLTAIVNVSFLEERLGTRLRLHPHLTFF